MLRLALGDAIPVLKEAGLPMLGHCEVTTVQPDDLRALAVLVTCPESELPSGLGLGFSDGVTTSLRRTRSSATAGWS